MPDPRIRHRLKAFLAENFQESYGVKKYEGGTFTPKGSCRVNLESGIGRPDPEGGLPDPHNPDRVVRLFEFLDAVSKEVETLPWVVRAAGDFRIDFPETIYSERVTIRYLTWRSLLFPAFLLLRKFRDLMCRRFGHPADFKLWGFRFCTRCRRRVWRTKVVKGTKCTKEIRLVEED